MTLEVQEADKRHPFRFMFKLLLFAGVVYALGRFVAAKKDEFSGLTESQARDKLVDKISPRVGEETASEIADSVIPKLKERGLVLSDPVTESPNGETGTTGEADEAAAADKA